MTEKNDNLFVSDESSAVISNKWVFSVAPNVAPTPVTNPYKVLDQKKTYMQLRLMPYNSSGSGTRTVFNITWPMYDTIMQAIDKALLGQLGEWDLGTAYNDNMSRIFGNPDVNGRCPARVLILRREPVMQDGSRAKLPWRIEIRNGTGEKIPTSSGGAYMKGGSFRENADGKCIARLSDGQMKEAFYWGSKLHEIFFQATKDGILRGHKEIISRKEEYKNH